MIYMQAFIVVLLFGKLMRKVFFGQLRTAEFEVRLRSILGRRRL